MKTKIYFFCLAVASTAFVSGVGFFCIGQYFQSAISPKTQKAEIVASAPIVVEREQIPVVEQIKTADDSEENSKYENSIDGYYGVVGELPKAFSDFGWIEVMTMNYENASEEDDYEGVPIAPEGNIYMDSDYKFSKISVNNKFMTFETEAIKGVSYKFSGKFVEKAPFWKLDEQKTVLNGRLMKMKKGKVIFEKNLSFFWYEGGC